jgi:hypothetical protein
MKNHGISGKLQVKKDYVQTLESIQYEWTPG